LTIPRKTSIVYNMKINLEDRLVDELNSIFDNKRTSQAEWDVCVEDIVEEYISRQRGYVDEDPLEEPELEEDDEIYIDLRNGTGTNGKHKHTITKPPFKNPSKNLRNRLR